MNPPNDTAVTPPPRYDPTDELVRGARKALAAAAEAEDGLREEYATPATYRANGHTARVADLHRASKYQLKVAEVEALIVNAQQLAEIAAHLRDLVADEPGATGAGSPIPAYLVGKAYRCNCGAVTVDPSTFDTKNNPCSVGGFHAWRADK